MGKCNTKTFSLCQFTFEPRIVRIIRVCVALQSLFKNSSLNCNGLFFVFVWNNLSASADRRRTSFWQKQFKEIQKRKAKVGIFFTLLKRILTNVNDSDVCFIRQFFVISSDNWQIYRTKEKQFDEFKDVFVCCVI